MILAIDTATRWTGIALHDGRQIIAEHGWFSTNTQTVELAPAVAAMAQRAEHSLADLSAIAVAIGPGSYTGLRIGLGLAKGLALANRVKLVGVNTLDITAMAVPRYEGLLAAVAEAGRTRICAGFYRWENRQGWQPQGHSLIVDWDSLMDLIEGPATFAGEISVEGAKLIRACSGKGKAGKLKLVAPPISVRRAGFLAEIGWKRLRRGRTDDPAGLAPIYLRDPAGAILEPARG
jgi:tRNA threonylcarbamoyladenosine biosynthesis protein TsaB